MNKAILVHGWASKGEYYNPAYPTGSNSHWFPWLTKQLMIRDIYTLAVEMPNGFYPKYEVLKREFERFDIDKQTILVGHSCGAGFLVRWLSENDTKVGKVILVAPWIGDDPGDEPFDTAFFDFIVDPEIAKRTKGLTIIHSTNDSGGVKKSVKTLISKLHDFRYVELENKGHFTLKSLKGEEFPELLEELVA